MSGEIRDLTNAEYHASDGLSASGAKRLLPPSCPAIYRYERDHPVYKDVFDFGSAAHKMVLQDGEPVIVEVDAPDWRTKDARDAKAEARAADKIPLLSKDVAVVKEMAEAIRQHPIASRLFAPGTGQVEPSLFWTDDRTGIPRRSKLDWLPETDGGRMILPEYKSAVSAEPAAFARAAMNLQYHQQHAWNVEAVRALDLAEDVPFVFVVQQKDAPYVVSVIELDPFAAEIGDHLNRRAIDTYAECIRTNTWPGYTDEVASVSLPYWYTREFEDLIA